MRLFKHLLDFYINSSIHVAFAVYALCWITLQKFDIKYNESVLYFNFYGTITGYNFVKYFGIAKWHHRRLASWLKIIQAFSFFCFVLMCYYGLQLRFEAQIIVAIMGVITFMYAIPFLPKKWYLDTQQNLRGISGLKVYIIAFVWSIVTVLFPVVNSEVTVDQDVIITFFQNFIFVIALMLPFEIRDLNYDSLKLVTIPQKIGVKRTKALGGVLLALFFFLEFFKNTIQTNYIITQFVVSTILVLLLLFTKKNNNNYYASFWVEALPIVWLILLLV